MTPTHHLALYRSRGFPTWLVVDADNGRLLRAFPYDSYGAVADDCAARFLHAWLDRNPDRDALVVDPVGRPVNTRKPH